MIDLLLKNAHIVIFVAIGLFTMWTKARKQQRQTGTGMPSFGGPTTAGAGERREKRPSKERSESQSAAAGSRAIRSEQEPRTASAASSGAAMSSGRPGAAATRADRPSEGGSDGRLTLDNAAQGVIWAEVLGQPRAKNPYRPR